ncbi:hypothetical protein AMS68_003200 [Peltaster fructicola]|uniref:Uncharacterized protein n=1 Tax=Peltaster fructicola TaxID=286661 RepID=A0A6H0XSI6_9PEZI|nr:hypothetical protein AMS68_003200 [Peltaster fructicola]
MAQLINLQIATFAGLGLPRTYNKPVPASTPACDVLETIYKTLPNAEIGPRLIVSTTDGRRISANSSEPISTYVNDDSAILPLRLSSRLCGGKGGFGSQLRAAGGRMSSRKNRDRENTNGSNRNLDGRRLRTVEEAKRLAQYLEMKPEMERKEREERKARWEAVIKAADETEEKIKAGKLGSNQGRLNAEYVENKELAEDKTREAVIRAMREGLAGKTGSESSNDEEMDSSEDGQEATSSSASEGAIVRADKASTEPAFFGWDEDEDDEDDEDDDVIDTAHAAAITVHQANAEAQAQLTDDLQTAVHVGKGKGKAV